MKGAVGAAGAAWVAPQVLTMPAGAQPGSGGGGGGGGGESEPELLGVHPWAAAQPTEWGRRLQDLAVFDGIVFCGFGDWNANTGPIQASGWHIVSGSFVAEAALDTESTWLLRRVGNRLVVPFIDPKANTGDLAVRSLGSPAWTTLAIGAGTAGTIHAFDVASFDGTDLWVAGAKRSTNDAAVWRSPSGLGGDWVESDVHAPLGPPGSYARSIHLGVHGGRLYAGLYEVQPGPPPFAVLRNPRVWDGSVWADAPEYGLEAGVLRGGHEPQAFGGRLLRRSRWLQPIDERPVYAFDGTALTDTGIAAIQMHVDLIGRLWWVAGDLVVRRLGPGEATPTEICEAPPGTTCLAAEGSALYLGTASSELWVVALS